MAAKRVLEKYLQENGVWFATMTHPEAYTAQEVAAVQHVPGKQLAKVVLVDADGQLVMLVLPASYRVDFPKLKSVLKAKKVRLASEEEFSGSFTDCEVGAMPPFGNLYDLPVHVDSSLADVPEIVFKVGNHKTSMKVKSADYKKLVDPQIADFAIHL
jgi:Ala-tRNA(Pro) deacylase